MHTHEEVEGQFFQSLNHENWVVSWLSVMNLVVSHSTDEVIPEVQTLKQCFRLGLIKRVFTSRS